MKNIKDTLIEAHTILKDLNIDHALIGGLALGNLGVHRATVDVDLLVDGSAKSKIQQAFEAKGYKLQVETDEVMHFTGDIAVDLLLANRAPTKKMLERASTIASIDVKCLKAEDIIGLKIQAYRNNYKRELQDKADIVSILQNNKDVDWELIKYYADIFNEWSTIENLRKKYEF